MPSLKRIAIFITIIQSVLWLAHFVVYATWAFSSSVPGALVSSGFKIALVILSISFTVSSLLALRYTNPAVRAAYKASATWLGLLSFLFLAAAGSWVIFGITRLAGLSVEFHRIVDILFAVALAVGIYGVFNANCTRITRATVRLANLPETWRGRKAALISD